MALTFLHCRPDSWTEAPQEIFETFSDDTLLAEMVRRKIIKIVAALALTQGSDLVAERREPGDIEDFCDDALFDECVKRALEVPDNAAGDIARAASYARQGNRAEAIIHIERALGGDFVGRLAI